MSKTNIVGEVKTVANPQKELVKLSNTKDTTGTFKPKEFADLIMKCLTFVTDESEIELYLVSNKGEKSKLGIIDEGLSNIRNHLNDLSEPYGGEWKLIFKSNKIEADYKFEGGKFSGKLDKLMKKSITHGVRMNEFGKISDKGSNVLASNDYLGINDIFQRYKENFAPTASLKNLIPLFIAIDSLNKKQFAQVYAEMSHLLNDQMSFNPLVEDKLENKIIFKDED